MAQPGGEIKKIRRIEPTLNFIFYHMQKPIPIFNIVGVEIHLENRKFCHFLTNRYNKKISH